MKTYNLHVLSLSQAFTPSQNKTQQIRIYIQMNVYSFNKTKNNNSIIHIHITYMTYKKMFDY